MPSVHTHECFKNERGLTVNDAFAGLGAFTDQSEEDEAFNRDASDVFFILLVASLVMSNVH